MTKKPCLALLLAVLVVKLGIAQLPAAEPPSVVPSVPPPIEAAVAPDDPSRKRPTWRELTEQAGAAQVASTMPISTRRLPVSPAAHRPKNWSPAASGVCRASATLSTAASTCTASAASRRKISCAAA